MYSLMLGKHVTKLVIKHNVLTVHRKPASDMHPKRNKTSVIGRMTFHSNATANERSTAYDASCFTEYHWTKPYQSSDVTLQAQ